MKTYVSGAGCLDGEMLVLVLNMIKFQSRPDGSMRPLTARQLLKKKWIRPPYMDPSPKLMEYIQERASAGHVFIQDIKQPKKGKKR